MDEGIDTGKIILKSKNKKIVNFSVFKIILSGYFLQSKLITKILSLKLKKRFPNFKKNKSGSVYTFPDSKTLKEIKKRRIDIFKFADYLFILKLSYIKNCKKLYNIIQKKITK